MAGASQADCQNALPSSSSVQSNEQTCCMHMIHSRQTATAVNSCEALQVRPFCITAGDMHVLLLCIFSPVCAAIINISVLYHHLKPLTETYPAMQQRS